jgi:hypothetical protein
MTCNWANITTAPNYETFSLTNPVYLALNRIFNVQHNFTTTGDYLVACNMSNSISFQVLEHNVTVYEQIQNFTTNLKFFPNGTSAYVDQPLYLLGLNMDQIEMGINTSFFFNFTQGIKETCPIIAVM